MLHKTAKKIENTHPGKLSFWNYTIQTFLKMVKWKVNPKTQFEICPFSISPTRMAHIENVHIKRFIDHISIVVCGLLY